MYALDCLSLSTLDAKRPVHCTCVAGSRAEVIVQHCSRPLCNGTWDICSSSGSGCAFSRSDIINLIGSRFEMNHGGRQKHSIKWQVSARPAQCLYTALCTAPQLACVDFGSTRFHSNTLSLFAWAFDDSDCYSNSRSGLFCYAKTAPVFKASESSQWSVRCA